MAYQPISLSILYIFFMILLLGIVIYFTISTILL